MYLRGLKSSSQDDLREEEETITELAEKAAVAREPKNMAPGAEMKLTHLTRIRFGIDRRLDEVTRMLQSTSPPSVKMDERIVK
jgi:hypothetical protein